MSMYKLILRPIWNRGALVLEQNERENGSQPPLRWVVIDVPHTYGGKQTISGDESEVVEAPACCYAPNDAEPAQRLYAVYNMSGPRDRIGLAWNGKPVPTWAELEHQAAAGEEGAAGVLAKWRAVAALAGRLTDLDWRDDPGSCLYNAYNEAGPPERAWLTWDGRRVPSWAQLTQQTAAGAVVAKWLETAERASFFGDRDWNVPTPAPAQVQ